MLETEKKDAERQAVRLEKDKDALRNTLDKVVHDESHGLPVIEIYISTISFVRYLTLLYR